jgi:hypothetical protein
MGGVLLRLTLLALGMGLIEIGLTDALGKGSLAGWGLVFLAGFPLVLVGTAGVIGPLFGIRRDRGGSGHD